MTIHYSSLDPVISLILPHQLKRHLLFVLLSTSLRHAEYISSVSNCNLLSDFLNLFIVANACKVLLINSLSYHFCCATCLGSQNQTQTTYHCHRILMKYFTVTYYLGISGNSSLWFQFSFNFHSISISLFNILT